MRRDLFPSLFSRPLALLLLCGLLASCGRPDITTANPTPSTALTPGASAAATPNLSATATAPPTATLTGPQLDATTTVNEALIRHAAETALALSPVPDLNWIPPTPDGPTPVRLRTGFSTGCADESEVHNLVINNCWVNVVNGEYVWVDAGSRRADSTVGRIDVFTFTLDFSDQSSRQYYETPQAKGAVTIIAVTGAHAILQYPDSSTVAFNLTTRTWEDPSTFPSPTPTATRTGAQLDATRTANEAIMRHAAETALALSPVPDLNWIPPTPESTPGARVRIGISEDCSDEYQELQTSNCWVGILNGEYVGLDAGRPAYDSPLGLIVVTTATLELSRESEAVYYEPPQAKGVVKIIAVNGSLVVLQYSDGSTVSFDLITRTWIDQHGPLPTLTPTVTIPTPTATTPSPSGTELPRSVLIEEGRGLFEPNADRYDPSVQYLTHSLGGVVTFSPNAVMMLPMLSSATGPTGPTPPQHVRLTFVGANPSPTIAPLDRTKITTTIASGMDSAKWKRIPTYLGIVYQALYPGIDLHYEGHYQELKSTYTVAAGANPDQIRLHYDGMDQIEIGAVTGELHLTLPPATTGASKPTMIIETHPVAWQEQGGTRVPVTVQYVRNADGSVGFALGSYNHAAALTIDPTISKLPLPPELTPAFNRVTP